MLQSPGVAYEDSEGVTMNSETMTSEQGTVKH